MDTMVKTSLKKHVTFNLICQIINYITPFILAPIVSRTLQAEGVGEYSYGLSIVYYFGIFIIFGFTDYGTRQISAHRDDKQRYSIDFWNILFVRFGFFAVSTSLYFLLIYNNILPNAVSTKIYYSFIILLIGYSVDISFLFQGLEKFKHLSLATVFVNIVDMFLVIFLVKNIEDLLTYSLLKSSIKISIAIILWFFSLKYIYKPRIIVRELGSIIKNSAIYFLPTLVMTIGPSVDQTMVGAISSNLEVGYYQQAHKITSLICAIAFAMSPILLSRITYLYEKNEKGLMNDNVSKLMRFSWFIIVPAVLGTYCIANSFIPLYFGDEYAPVVEVLYFFLPCVFFSGTATFIINGYYYPTKKVLKCTLILGICVILNIITNFLAIRYFGSKGAALTSSIAGFIETLLLMMGSKKEIKYFEIIKKSYKIFLSSLIMLCVLLILNHLFKMTNFTSLLLITAIDIFIGMLVYLISCTLFQEELLFELIKSFKFKISKIRSK